MVSVKEKREFLSWFLNNYQLKERECVWVLNYLMNSGDRLKNIRFVSESISHYKRGMTISELGFHNPSFQFFKNGVLSTDIEKTFHDIRLNKQEITYIKLNYKDCKSCPKYASVLEDDMKVPLNSEFSKLADKIMNHCLVEGKRSILKKQIDMALDQGNKEEFHRLSSELLLVK